MSERVREREERRDMWEMGELPRQVIMFLILYAGILFLFFCRLLNALKVCRVKRKCEQLELDKSYCAKNVKPAPVAQW